MTTALVVIADGIEDMETAIITANEVASQALIE